MAAPQIQLFVETPEGLFVRRVQAPSVLPTDRMVGDAAEDATRNAAAYWGLPDFVFRPALRARGSGNREIGDAILTVGELAVCVQVKARERTTDVEARERGWLDKKIGEGIGQSRGTIRNLHYSRRVTLENERGREIVLTASERKWVRVVVLDHPGVEGYVPAPGAVVLLRRDWEFLFTQLKSTYAVLEYLARVDSLNEPIELGTEPVRYYQLAAADAVASPAPLDPRLAAIGTSPLSRPLLPQKPAEFGEIVRIMLEDIATTRWPEGTNPTVVHDLLGAIDTLPVAYRGELGATILEWLKDVSAETKGVKWRFRRMTGRPGKPHVILATAGRYDEGISDGFGAYVCLRHQQQLELIPEEPDLCTVGVLITPRDDGLRKWDTSAFMTKGEQGFDVEYRAFLEALWGEIGESVMHDDPGPILEAIARMDRASALPEA